MKITSIAFLLSLMLILANRVHGEESAAATSPATPSRAPASMMGDGNVEPIYENQGGSSSPGHIANKDGKDGARILVYYDPLSSYSKLVTNLSGPTGFGYASTTGGMGGVQAMWSVWAPSDWEFQAGLDYVFPVNVQGQQDSSIGTYVVQSQTLSIVGLKIVQVNYRLNFGDFTVAPYGGLGIYYGKNSVTLTNRFAGSDTDILNYTKLMAVYTAGARVDYNFNRARTLALSAGFEFFVPTKLTDQFSQTGSAVSEIQGGNEPFLQSNMDFLTGIGARLYLGLAGYF